MNAKQDSAWIKYLFKGKFLYVWLLLVLISCYFYFFRTKHTPQRAMYYWKTVFKLSETEKKALSELKIHRLYVKFFDVKQHTDLGFPIPVGVLKLKENVPDDIEIIPVVYIVNDVLKRKTHAELEKLAKSILEKVASIHAGLKKTSLQELQIDCDWTGSTKDQYFYLLKQISSMKSDLKLSATLRLHQYSNPVQTGIPPVRSVSLMCYNLQKSKTADDQNSIIDTETLRKYFAIQNNYPLKLSIALPIFSWTVVFRHHKPVGIVYALSESELDKLPVIKSAKDKYKVLQGCSFRNIVFQKGDELKVEKSDINTLLQASGLISKTLENPVGEIIIFDLNERYLQSDFTNNDLESLYNSFNAVPAFR